MMELVNRWDLSTFSQWRDYYEKAWNYGHQLIKTHCKFLLMHSYNGTVVIATFVSFLFVMICAYAYIFPSPDPLVPSYPIPAPHNSAKQCNVFDGRWVKDASYPLYNSSQCSFAERGFNCLANGRKDRDYLKWRWKPKHCDVPRFDARVILERLRGKRVVFVGDSLSRTQWESLICMLMTGVEDKNSVYEINGNKITKRIRFLGVLFRSHSLRIDFYRSVFLVQPGIKPKRAPKRVKSTIKLDTLDDISKEWIDSDILVFNSAHWWTPTKLFEM